ncbi:PQQ-binding-like beta-propeller repeat protein [Pyxidicoccus sp. MSG2]|uniref:outer membrane protein assembly factor BamB family protein n=1 Tax=Pyxidicoccus sp. MSG2 TaxID=2996790 RepID=UPI00226F84A3|nr:PQQ-binding-like beta-propeller repeat protein [Pyxidicoccus sp. MSG2]MCY1016389.1 PQQ-binding-like beta-propeller repeat protein [Pyxidicoccus sp. MSG2]
MRRWWGAVLGVCVWAGCSAEHGGGAVEAPAGEVAPAPEAPPSEAGDPVVEQEPPVGEPGDAGVPDEPTPPEACSGPDGTARLAWSHDAAWDQSVDFRGTMDADGRTYWTECDSAYWSDKDPSQLQCHLVSATREGAIRFRLLLPRNGLTAVHAVDAEKLYLTSASTTLSAQSLEDGRELWSADLAKLRTEDPQEARSFLIDSVSLGSPYVLAVVRNTFGDEDGKTLLVALRADTGAVAWTVLTPAVRTPVVLDAEGNVYGGSFDAAAGETTLFSYTREGRPRWQVRRVGELQPSSVEGGRLVLGRAEVADAATGATVATLATTTMVDGYFSLGQSSSAYGRVAFQAGGSLFLPAPPCTGAGCPTELHPGRTFLYGLSPEDGSPRWHRAVGAWPMSPLLTQRDSLLLIDRPAAEGCEESNSCVGDDSSSDSFLRELAVDDGRELAACALPGRAPYITPPALHEGRVVLGAWTNWLASNDWTRRMSIRAFDLSVSTGPATTGWVSAGGGNSRSGQATPRP